MEDKERGIEMTQRKDVEQKLHRLLKSRQIPVDEDRLETMRESLLRRVAAVEALPAPGFLYRHRFATSFAAVCVLIGLLVWKIDPLNKSEAPSHAVFTLMEVIEDDEQLDHALVLLSGFASKTAQGRTVLDLEAYNRTMLSDNVGEELLETFYGQS